jgi:hypothetical protein
VKTQSKEFQNYAWFSVQVDQYFHAIRIFARHYDALKAAYVELPQGNDWPKDTSCLSTAAKTFFIRAASAFNYMGTTGIFADSPYPELRSMPTDIVNFGFYTCYCFQWTLFENFTKSSVLGLANDCLLPADTCNKLRASERRTRDFLKIVDSGEVFGHSPFVSILPMNSEQCDFEDLDAIREQRNKFIHAVKDASILPTSEGEKEVFMIEACGYSGNSPETLTKMFREFTAFEWVSPRLRSSHAACRR